MGLCQDLARYGMGRATARDVESVTQARNLVQEILEYLLTFDFRSGYLRRKYDGTKYALKTLETILYELSVTGGASLPLIPIVNGMTMAKKMTKNNP
jgi:predicted translin family RNA/ssDNA-binding protein